MQTVAKDINSMAYQLQTDFAHFFPSLNRKGAM